MDQSNHSTLDKTGDSINARGYNTALDLRNALYRMLAFRRINERLPAAAV
ncbi:hypothetical protein [Paraburkholderia sp. D1E]